MRLAGFNLVTDAEIASRAKALASSQAPPPIALRAEASGDLFALIAGVIEWGDAYQASLDLVAAPSTTEEERKARYLVRERFSKAESALRALARRCTR